MKSSTTLPVLFLCAACAFAQQAPSPAKTTPSTSKPATATTSSANSGLKGRGPEAVAAQDPNRVVATINGKQITAQQAVGMIKQIPEDQRRSIPSLATLVERVYMFDQFADQAEKLKLDQQSPWKEQIDLSRKQVLAQAYMNQMGTNDNSPAAKQYYDAHPADFDQIKLSGILVAFNPPGTPSAATNVKRSEPEAQAKANDLEKKIRAGGDFSALARTDSDNQQSSVRGGELGTFVMGDSSLPPEIKTAVDKLKSGEISEPIRVSGGYYIFKVDSRTRLPYDRVKAGIVRKLEFDKYKIQVQDPDFFASSSPSSNIPSLQRPGASTDSATPAKPQGQ